MSASREATAATAIRRRAIQVTVPVDTEPMGPIWTFPGNGSAKDIHVPTEELAAARQSLGVKKHQLNEWPATAISGNDILSSVLYTAGLVTAKAGKLAPIPLLLVACMLYFFRFIYEEVVTAIPLNGGSYNVLLNTTSKRVASFGAALSIISYLATGVVGATSGVNYLHSIVETLPVVATSIAVLFVFAVLAFFGITDSSRVALCIFTHHALVLTVLSIASLVYVVPDTHVFVDNMATELPQVDFAGNLVESNVFSAVFFGFGAACLGITGFETSAQYVEEQKPGVFRKTLRNMWASASIFNTLLMILALGVLPVDEIIVKKDFLLAEMGEIVVGHWFKVWIAIDGFIVLSGSVLTSYVGITGLVRRLACDRILPAFLMTQNKWRGTNHWIILAYFLIGASLVLVLNADMTITGGVFAFAFLSLMTLFACGCMALKAKRATIPRDTIAPWWTCMLALLFVVAGLLANLLGDPKVLMYFALYLIVVLFVITCMLERVTLHKLALSVLRSVLPSRHRDHQPTEEPRSPLHSFVHYDHVWTPPVAGNLDKIHTGARGGRTIAKAILSINDAPIVFFCKHPDLALINKAIMYVRRNEQTHTLRIVHVSEVDGEDSGAAGTLQEFESIAALFNFVYPKLRIDFVHVHGEFEPAVVKWLSESMRVPVNLMFITQPSDTDVHSVAKLGVRVITA